MKKILILEGGYNEEHEISLNTSKEVQKSLKRMKLKFEVLRVNPSNFSEKIKLYNNNFLCFNALHGSYGEDGTIQIKSPFEGGPAESAGIKPGDIILSVDGESLEGSSLT